MFKPTLLALSAGLAIAGSAAADEIVIPNHAPTTAGPGGYSTLLHSQPRSYQLVVGPSELEDMPAGSMITGITWRRPTWQVFASWPGAGLSADWVAYDITLSTSLRAPGSLSTTYTDNIGPDAVQVRAGPISIADAFFPGGAMAPAVNPFGQVIPFATPYEYKGGNLLLTIRHTGNDVGLNGSLDTVSSPDSQALGVSSYTQPDSWYAQGLITMKLTFEPPSACPADLNGDGIVDFSDYLEFLNLYETLDPRVDFNHDGIVDFSDYLEFLNLYDAGC
ncbi:MAG: hypothetical protein IT436_05845 [Phycisphaerales bacterium]|nr:hypothetical protein [Phycisphaerales bacterium]